MFDFLKKKISDFTGKIKEAIKAAPSQPPKKEEQAPVYEEKKDETAPQSLPAAEEIRGRETAAKEEAAQEKPEPETRGEEKPEGSPAPETEKEAGAAPMAVAGEKPRTVKTREIKGEARTALPSQAKKPQKSAAKPAPAVQVLKEEPAAVERADEFKIAGEEKTAIEKATEIRGEEKRELKAKVGLVSKIFGFVGGKIKITEKETQGFFEEFELSLLEADVQQDAAQAIVGELKSRLVGKEISSRDDVTVFLKKEVRESLAKVMQTQPIDVTAMLKGKKPLKVMFLGPNGAGKTTSIAKLANFFIKQGKTVILAAGDTFRAASIEQLEAHANALGVKVVKHKYGSDPAAVAFDAVKAAEAKGIDVVLIDTAGRQDTNRNLIEELRKIERVVKPDLKLYVGEAFTGQALLQQATEFDKAVGVDGFVLTKIDTDTKGGTAISLLYSLKKPIVFVGTGQRYEDLLEFRPEFIIDRII